MFTTKIVYTIFLCCYATLCLAQNIPVGNATDMQNAKNNLGEGYTRNDSLFRLTGNITEILFFDSRHTPLNQDWAVSSGDKVFLNKQADSYQLALQYGGRVIPLGNIGEHNAYRWFQAILFEYDFDADGFAELCLLKANSSQFALSLQIFAYSNGVLAKKAELTGSSFVQLEQAFITTGAVSKGKTAEFVYRNGTVYKLVLGNEHKENKHH